MWLFNESNGYLGKNIRNIHSKMAYTLIMKKPAIHRNLKPMDLFPMAHCKKAIVNNFP